MFIVPQTAATPLPSSPRGRKWLVVGGVVALLAVIIATVFLRTRGARDTYPSQAISTARDQQTAATNKAPAAVQAQPAPVFAEDADGDGLADVDEQKYGTDPKKSDTDGDGASDSEEVFARKTDPLKPDTVPVHPALLQAPPSTVRP